MILKGHTELIFFSFFNCSFWISFPVPVTTCLEKAGVRGIVTNHLVCLLSGSEQIKD